MGIHLIQEANIVDPALHKPPIVTCSIAGDISQRPVDYSCGSSISKHQPLLLVIMPFCQPLVTLTTIVGYIPIMLGYHPLLLSVIIPIVIINLLPCCWWRTESNQPQAVDLLAAGNWPTSCKVKKQVIIPYYCQLFSLLLSVTIVSYHPPLSLWLSVILPILPIKCLVLLPRSTCSRPHTTGGSPSSKFTGIAVAELDA